MCVTEKVDVSVHQEAGIGHSFCELLVKDRK